MKDCVPQKGPWLVTEAWKRNDGHVCPSPGFGQERKEDLVERCRVFLNLLGSQGTPVIRWVCQFFLAGCPWPFDSSDPVALTSSSISSLLNMSMLPIRKVGVNAFFIQPRPLWASINCPGANSSLTGVLIMTSSQASSLTSRCLGLWWGVGSRGFPLDDTTISSRWSYPGSPHTDCWCLASRHLWASV